MRYDNASMNQLFGFISQSVFEITSQMNSEIWKHSQSKKMKMNVVGAWFAVHYVQVDDDKR